MFKKLLMGIGLVAMAATVFAADPTAAELLAILDKNEVYSSIQYSGEMVINYNGRRYVKTFTASARSNNDSFMEFTNKEDTGTKYLKNAGRLYVYSPDTEEVMLISGHMLKESMMGSDMSYEDTINNDTLAARYNATIIGREDFNGRQAYKLELIAKNKTESYPKRTLWIDVVTNDCLHYEMYALSGAKLKEYTLIKAETIGSRRFPVEAELRDTLRKGSSTTFKMLNVELDKPIPDSVFGMNNLKR
jgi:outer membrane lipoprotein-sorting protein